MFRRIISKFVITAIITTIIIATIGQSFVNAAKKTESIDLALSQARVIKNGSNFETKGAYALSTGSDHPIYQIVKIENGHTTGTNFLCVNANVGRTWTENIVGTSVTYNTSYDLSTDKELISALRNEYKNIAGTNYSKIMWLLDNILIGDYTEDDIDAFLAKVGIVKGNINLLSGSIESYYFDVTKYLNNSQVKSMHQNNGFAYSDSALFNSLYGNGGYYYENTSGANVDVRLSREQIEAIEQAVIWHFTNNDSTEYNSTNTYTTTSDTVPKQFLKYYDGGWKTLDKLIVTGDAGEVKKGEMLQEQASILYNYLIDAANAYSNDYTASNVEIKFAGNQSDEKIVEQTDNYKVGPLKITTTGKTIINGISVTSGTSTTEISGVTLQNASGTTITKPTEGQNFYCLVPKNNVSGDIKVKVNATAKNGEKKLRILDTTGNPEQPIVEINPKSINASITIPLEMQFDLALRKTIVGIKNNNGTTKAIVNEAGNDAVRTINADSSSIPNTATYKHRKDPVVVENGDIITFRITIYNEGQIDGYASKIVDQLPTGLQSVLAANETVTSHNGNIYKITNYENNKIELSIVTSGTVTSIEKFKTNNLKSDYIELDCRVTGTANADGKTNQYLTNIAYIAEGYDSENNQVVTQDRDGNESKTTNSPNKTASQLNSSNANDYKGKTTNKSVYSDTNNVEPYEGEEDDDDFEKVVILPKQFDLKLMKYITAINEDTVSNDRRLTIDSSNLNKVINGKKVTTANYDISKVPLVVKTGDYVTYTFRIFNESEVDGYASEITENIPDGLEYDASKNTAGVWQLSSDGKKLTTDFLSKAKNTDNLIRAFNSSSDDGKGSGLSYKDVTLTLKVTSTNTANIIRNEAAITEDTDSEGNEIDDRDSDTEEWKKENSDETYENNPNYPKYKEDDEDYDNIKLASFDVALRKFISKVSKDGNFSNTSTTTTYNRAPQIDSSNLKSGTENTAKYNHSKEAVQVNTGDYILYTIRAYNEGDLEGYASEIIDDLPNYLDFVESTDSYIKSINDKWNYDSTTRKAKTTSSSANATTKLSAFNSQTDDGKGSGLSYVDVQIICRVNKNATIDKKLTNIAEITEYKDENGNVIEPTTGDRDSKPNNFPDDLKSEETRPNYNGGTDRDTTDNYIPGQEDDDDFEKVIVKERKVDLALTKFIAAVSVDEKIEDGEYLTPNKNKGSKTNEYIRATVADTTGLKNGTSSNATYRAKKDLEPLAVNKNSYILYDVRVYNEGETDVYAGEITDYLPENLEFVDAGESKQFGWVADGQTVKTTYLSSKNGSDKILKAFDKANDDGKGSGLDYVDLQILCKVSDKAEEGKKMVNTAEITKYEDEDGNDIPKDVDSEPENKEEKNVENREQDDDDYEVIIIKNFDLALRKFITEIGGKEIDSRVPNLSYEDGRITYSHSKDVLRTTVGDTVVYTLRVYNEGDIAGYAQEISDDIPEYLEFLPEHSTNRTYKWVMYDADGVSTTKIADAVRIKTDYTSKANGELLMKEDEAIKENPNLLKAFDKKAGITENNPDFVDVKVAFKVKDPKSNKTVIVNKAQISDDADENGNPIEDVDSKPDVWNDGEDDQDYENIAVDYFDLALLKYVTKTIVTENGKTKTTKTGNNGSDKDITPKVEIYRRSVNKVTVKFEYTIKITNEGDIAGYAKEITDYVPNGLKFYKEDNKGWKDEGNNVISTTLLKDTLLQPGQSATVKVILRWVNGENNLGVKTNVAEISKDYNEKGVPDRDSTPDNKKKNEDDIDDAPVLLTISTGTLENTMQYVTGALIILVVLGTGLFIIKKYVL